MAPFWQKGHSPARDWAIRRWEMLQWFDRLSDAELEYFIQATEAHRRAPEEWIQNAEICKSLLAWRHLGADGPFR